MSIWATPVRTAGLVLASSLAMTALSDVAWGEGQKSGSQGSNSAQSTAPTDSDTPPKIITAEDVDAIADALWFYDADPKITKDDNGNPMIRVDDSKTAFSVYFHDCTDGKDCGYIEFVAGWDLKNGIQQSTVEKWNETKLWGVAYRDKQNDPWLSMTVNLRDGVTADNFDDTVGWWDDTMSDYADFIGWKK